MIADGRIIHTISHPVLDMDTLSTEREDRWSIVPDEDTDVMIEL
jgi:hypothetical protein